MKKCSIHSTTYPVLDWQTTRVGEELEESWETWHNGMGETTKYSGQGFYTAADSGVDTTAYGMARISPVLNAVTATGVDASTVGYFFETVSPNGTKYVYFCQGEVIYKLNFTTGATVGTNKTVTGGVAGVFGKPFKFGGVWHIPQQYGAGVIQKLTTVHNTLGANDDTWTTISPDLGSNWTHGTVFQLNNAPVIALSYSDQIITNTTSSATGWTAQGEVGDSSTVITDLVEAQGFLYVAKEDNLYEFDTSGSSKPIIPFLNRDNVDVDNGRGSHAFGDIIFYPSTQGLWRYRIGIGALPIGPDTIRTFTVAAGQSPSIRLRHRNVFSMGEWIYSAYGTALLCGRLRREGDAPGHEMVWHEILNGISNQRAFFTDSAYKIWMAGALADKIFFTDAFGADGGPGGATTRGAANNNYTLVFDERDFGFPYVQKQLRICLAELENWSSQVTGRVKFFRDGGSVDSDNIINSTSGGVLEGLFTVGTRDTCYRVRPEFQFVVGGTWTNTNDPRLLRLSLRARSPDEIEVTIPADQEILKEYGLTPETVEDNLRHLQNAGAGATSVGMVAVREPGPEAGQVATSSFNAQVVAVTDGRYDSPQGINYVFRVTLRRWITD